GPRGGLNGGGQIGCGIERPGRPKGIDTGGVLYAGAKRAIARGFEVDQIVYVEIPADAADRCGKAAVDDRSRRSESRPKRRCHVRETPCGRSVPRVLYGWIVVCRDPVSDVHLAEGRSIRIANI